MFTYINAIVKAAYNSGLLYATSDKHEGYLFIAGEGVGSIGFSDGMKMIFAEKKALGGWKNMKNFISASFSDGCCLGNDSLPQCSGKGNRYKVEPLGNTRIKVETERRIYYGKV